MEPRLLILETSGRGGFVAAAQGPRLLDVRRLDETRRHARDLEPAAADLIQRVGWQPRDIQAVAVGKGPGSYTGLRVGVMAAKAFAYATGCALVAVETFAAIARQAPPEALRLDVVADAQQDRIYRQSFTRPAPGGALAAASVLAIGPAADWINALEPGTWVTGPGLRGVRNRLPAECGVVVASAWDPQPGSVLASAIDRMARGERDDVWSLEPLYLRPSSAEEKWDSRTSAPPP